MILSNIKKNLTSIHNFDISLSGYKEDKHRRLLFQVHVQLKTLKSKIYHVLLNKTYCDSVTQPNLAVPAWQRKVERRIDRTRLLISKLLRFREGSTEPRVMHFVKQAFSGSGVSPLRYKSRVTERIDFLKRKVCAWTNKIRKHKRRIQPETETKKNQKRKEQYEQRWVLGRFWNYVVEVNERFYNAVRRLRLIEPQW